jgi:hypothetical protein
MKYEMYGKPVAMEAMLLFRWHSIELQTPRYGAEIVIL